MAHLLVFWGGVQCGYNGFAHEPFKYAASIEVPTLLLQGKRDATVSEHEAVEIFRNLGTSKKKLAIFHGASHDLYGVSAQNVWKENVLNILP